MLHSLSPASRQSIGDSHSTQFYERRVVVIDGSINTVTLNALSQTAILRVWIPNSILFLKGPHRPIQLGLVNQRDPLKLIVFESNSCLTRIESKVFSSSSLQSILIPRSVEILGSDCFSYCKSFSSITFESNSHLTRIESRAFSYSSLQSIIIPRNVQFIDGSAFINVTLSSISIESGNEIFIIEKDILIDVLHHKLIRNFSNSSAIEIGSHIEILGSNCFFFCVSLSSIT
jgi:hypothetical protein